jgi:hypothetical protein
MSMSRLQHDAALLHAALMFKSVEKAGDISSLEQPLQLVEQDEQAATMRA